ncbi:YDL129W [Zygosaccharomyces parabailii]|nr:YDL129W [Zygosaccharomyces parabailii]CDH13472.1 uncharacterized protein ZBAI_05258 [Zygosaccharomyces bailii ISA1307]
MESARGKPVQVHLVTPEEPQRHGSARSDEVSRDSGTDIVMAASAVAVPGKKKESEDIGEDAACFMPSVKNTRKLETEIMVTIQCLRNQEDDETTVDRQHVIDLLNRSLTAISHWSLQAQLAQLRKNVDDRQLVETNLLRKEMEVLVSRQASEPCSPKKQKQQQQPQQQYQQRHQQQNMRRRVPRSPSLVLSTTTHSSKVDSSPASPSTPQKKVVKSPIKRHTASTTGSLLDPLKLVESKKPHPRMRRTSDNPMASEYVRVFHLQRK